MSTIPLFNTEPAIAPLAKPTFDPATIGIKPSTLNVRTKIMLGIQGPANSGKTESLFTFPNLIVANFDNGLQRHPEFQNDLRFHDAKWCKDNCAGRENARDAFEYWLEFKAKLIPSDWTLGVDTWTTLQDAFDIQTDKEPVTTSKGEVDEFAFWGRKQDYARNVINMLKNLPCNVVVNFHEQPERDKKGNLTGQVNPLMQGRFVDKIPIYFSDFFRMTIKEKKEKKDGKDVVVDTEWHWQVKSDAVFKAKSRAMFDKTTYFVPANYSSLKYGTQ